MKFKAFVAICLLILAGLLLWLVPPHYWRSGGTLDVVVLIDTSGSTSSYLPSYRDMASSVLATLLPGDRLAVIYFDSEAHVVYKGVIGSGQTLETVRQQISSLETSKEKGTVLPSALAQAGDALVSFNDQHPSNRIAQRILFLYSDGQTSMPEEAADADWAQVHLPDQMSVLAIGFEGVAKDQVVQSLLGPGSQQGEGSNDVHIISMQDAEPAMQSALKLVSRAHPWNFTVIALTAFGLVVAGLLLFFALLREQKPRMQTVRVRLFGSDEEWEMPPDDGQSIQIGRRQDIPIDTDSIAVLTRANRDLLISRRTASDIVAIIRNGHEIPVKEPTALHFGDRLQIDGVQLEVESAA